MNKSRTSVPRPVTSDVTFERLDGEVIAVHLRSGRYYSMSGPAADIWTLMEVGVPRDRWAALLSTAFGIDDIDDDAIWGFVTRCLDATLVLDGVASEVPSGWDLPSDYERVRWASPVLEEFDDLQDLILVDPVHDTTALGWPHVADADG